VRESKVYLEPIEHVYIHKDTGQKYKSVTTVLSMLEPEFESEKIAQAIENQDEERKKERYKSMTKDEILEAWRIENEEANAYGTEIHEILERYLLAKRLYIPKSDYEREIITKFQEVDDMAGEIYPETILFSEKHSLAGTADIIEDCGDYFNVRDFKTNKRIEYISQYGHWLNKPVSHLSDCQFNIYSLQMSIYAYMYQMETRKKVGKLNLYYYNPETLKFDVIYTPYMGLEAKTVLDWYLKNN
jgi:hypothetical protein